MELNNKILGEAHDRIAETVANSEEWPTLMQELQRIFQDQSSDLLLAACAYLIDVIEHNGLPHGFGLALLAYHSGVQVEMTYVEKKKAHSC